MACVVRRTAPSAASRFGRNPGWLINTATRAWGRHLGCEVRRSLLGAELAESGPAGRSRRRLAANARDYCPCGDRLADAGHLVGSCAFCRKSAGFTVVPA